MHTHIGKGREIRIDNKTYTCCGIWMKGKNISKYEFKTPSGAVITRDYQYIQDLINNKIIELL